MLKKEAAINATNATMGGMSIISSYNVCHSVCTVAIAVLSLFGIAVSGMPLFFLTQYQAYFWGIGMVFLAVAVTLYFWRGPCISKHMILANAGLLFAGFPFAKSYFMLFMVAGFAVVAAAVALYLAERANGEN